MGVYEIYVEKKPDFAEEAASVAADLRLGVDILKTGFSNMTTVI